MPLTAPTPALVGVHGLCPRCGVKTLFATYLRFAERCGACGLDFAQFNVGDGPAAFLTLIIGTLVVIGAVALQLAFTPPLWLQMAIWVPVTTLAVIWSLRIAKGVLLAIEYRQAAREGRIAEPAP